MIRAAYKVLILEDNPADAAWLSQMLASLTDADVDAVVHHSQQGIFPATETAEAIFGGILLADGYAQTDTLQMLELLSQRFPAVPVGLLSNGDIPAPSLLAAARKGLFQVLDKDKLSRKTLHDNMLEMYRHGQQQNSRQPLFHQPGGAQQAAHPVISDPAAHSHDQQAHLPRPSIIDTLERQENTADSGHVVDTGHVPEPRARSASSQARPADVSRRAFNELSTGVVWLSRDDNDFIIADINASACSLNGVEASTVVGGTLEQANFNYQNLSLRDALNELQTSEGTIYRGVLQLDQQGEPNWLDLSIRDLGDKQLVLEIHRSPRRDEDTAVIENKQRSASTWRDLAGSLPDFTALLDESGHIAELISGDWQLLQADSEGAKGMAVSELFAAPQGEHCEVMLNRALNTGKPQHAMLHIEQTDKTLSLQTTISLLRTGTGTERYGLLVARDVTVMQEQQDALEFELNRIMECAEQAPFAAAVIGSDGRFEQINPAFGLLFSLAADEILGKTEQQVFSAELSTEIASLNQRMHETGARAEQKLSIDAHSPQYNFVRFPLAADGEQESAASCLMILPAAAQALLETDSLEQQHRLSQPPTDKHWPERTTPGPHDAGQRTDISPTATRQQNARQKKNAEQDSLSIEQLVTGIASDFNSLMSSMSSSAEENGDEPLTEHDQEARLQQLESVHKASRHAQELIVKMFAYRESNGHDSQAADLSETTRRTLQLLEQSARGSLNITSDVEGGIFAAEQDVIEIQKLLIDMYQHLHCELTMDVVSRHDDRGRCMQAAMHMTIQLDQSCVCCFQKIDGYYLEISLASGDHSAEPGQTVRNLSSDLTEDDILVANMLALHANAKAYSGHLMLNMGEDGSQSWRMLIPVAGNGTEGISLDNSLNEQAQRRLS